jgi:hypothetical protein
MIPKEDDESLNTTSSICGLLLNSTYVVVTTVVRPALIVDESDNTILTYIPKIICFFQGAIER